MHVIVQALAWSIFVPEGEYIFGNYTSQQYEKSYKTQFFFIK